MAGDIARRVLLWHRARRGVRSAAASPEKEAATAGSVMSSHQSVRRGRCHRRRSRRRV